MAATRRASGSADSTPDLVQLRPAAPVTAGTVRAAQLAVASVALGQADPESYARDVLAVLGIGVRV
ncbi:MAG TPA: hypothetical protein VFM54_13295 [Micromonosporaceae bacterium]|nr:hypothetical protein [Micromonosporaceae bacterium]